MGLRRTVTGIAAVTGLVVAGGAGFAIGRDTGPDAPPVTPPIALANADLTVASSCDALLDSYVDRGLDLVGPYGWGGDTRVFAEGDATVGSGAPTASGSARSMATTSRATSNESGTNVQEAGVDESDVVKVAGPLLVRMRRGELLAYDVSGERPALLSTTPVLDGTSTSYGSGGPDGELLLVGGRAVVLGTSDDGSRTSITTVDLADPTAPRITSTDEVNGRATAARLTGDVVRVVVSTDLPQLDFSFPHGPFGELRSELHNRSLVRATTLADWVPTINGEQAVDCDDVAVPADHDLALGTTTVLAFRPADPAARTMTAVATGTQTSYVSTDRLYLAAGEVPWGRGGPWSECLDCRSPGFLPTGTTTLFAFALDGTATTYVASGEVRGTIADRWSMDAVGDSLRVAVGPGSETADANSVLTLREEGSALVEEGRVDGLGVGEDIQSVRWFDDLAIVVTFRQVDPLYAVDLTDPGAPVLLGQLKIPGYSDYLHPLGEHRLIGMGQAADGTGSLEGAQAALFDVTDLTDPRQLDVVRYGPGSWAAAGSDPRAFTWLPDRRTVLTVVERSERGGSSTWVSVLALADGRMSDRMVEVAGTSPYDVRLVPLASGAVALVTSDDVAFFPLAAG